MADVSFTTLGPLTTTFIPPATCTSGYLNIQTFSRTGGESSYTDYKIDYTPYGTTLTCYKPARAHQSFVAETTAEACYPTTTAFLSDAYNLRTVYSPGAICPSGLTLDCTLNSLEFLGNIRVIPTGETWAICCPSQYTCVSFPLLCVRTVFAGQFISGWAIPSPYPAGCSSVYTTAPALTRDSLYYADPFILARKAADPPFAEKPHHTLPAPFKDDTHKKEIAYDVGLGVGVPGVVIVIVIVVLSVQSVQRKKKQTRAREAAEQ